MDFSTSYNFERPPIFGKNIVASSQPLATQAGLKILEKGGNAIDAVIAAAAVLTVVEPTGSGLGSDANVIISDGTKIQAINGTGHSPAGWTRKRFSMMKKMPLFGWDSVTVPGAVKLWWHLSKRFGRTSFSDLFESAIYYATNGYIVGNKIAYEWSRYIHHIKNPSKSFKEEFYPAPKVGNMVMRANLAVTLEEIATTGYQSFYEGAIASEIVNQSNQEGGVISIDDLAAHNSEWITPIRVGFRHVEVLEMPPNTQGIYALVALGILNYLPIAELDSIDFYHYQIEAMKLSFYLCEKFIADPDFIEFRFNDHFNSDALSAYAAQISRSANSICHLYPDESKDTVYLAAADASGFMASFIQSNYLGFGSGVVINNRGIALQNRGAGFSLNPSSPNRVGPRKRPFHTIIPGMVTEDGRPLMVFGVTGGPMQAQGHLQLLDRVITYDLNPQAACDAPRWQVTVGGDVIVESTFPSQIARELVARGHSISYETDTLLFGGAQVIKKFKEGYVAGSDPRKDGCAAGI